MTDVLSRITNGTPVKYIPIGGTRAWNDRNNPHLRWWQSNSDFCRMMASLNCQMYDPKQPFVWTTDLNGIQFWRRWTIFRGLLSQTRDHRDWIAAGENLLRYVDSLDGPINYSDRNLISHSHGFQLVAYACSFGLKIRRLISLSPPYRHDMEDVITTARPNIEKWILILDEDDDEIAEWGQFGDGVIRTDRSFDDNKNFHPDEVIKFKEISHSRLLNDKMNYWSDFSLDNFLR